MKHWLTNTHWIEIVKKSGPVGELKKFFTISIQCVFVSQCFVVNLINYFTGLNHLFWSSHALFGVSYCLRLAYTCRPSSNISRLIFYTDFFPFLPHFWHFLPCTSQWGKFSSSKFCISDFRIEIYIELDLHWKTHHFLYFGKPFYFHTFGRKMWKLEQYHNVFKKTKNLLHCKSDPNCSLFGKASYPCEIYR